MKKLLNIYLAVDINDIYCTNPFLTEFIFGLENNCCAVQHGLFRLPVAHSNWNIVNFQWPEAIFSWREPNQHDLTWFKARLRAISTTARIVTTIHNTAPHYRNTNGFAALYRVLYQYSDAFVHLGQASVDILLKQYPDECTHKIHRVIPHGNYNVFGPSIAQVEARAQLHLPATGQLVLVVGAFRNKEEYDLVINSLPHWVNAECGLILAATFGFKPALRPRTAFKRLWYEAWVRLQNLMMRHQRYVFIKPGPIPHEQMAALVCAADVVLIPRVRALNSGNVPLGFTYSKVVVGPDVGVVGQILKDTNNPVFKPDADAMAVAAAIKQGLELASAGQGRLNGQIAQTDWDWGHIELQYRQLFEELLKS